MLQSGHASSQNSSHGSRGQQHHRVKGMGGVKDHIGEELPNYRESPIEVIESAGHKEDYFINSTSPNHFLKDDLAVKNAFLAKIAKSSKRVMAVFHEHDEKASKYYQSQLEKLLADYPSIRKIKRDDSTCVQLINTHFMLRNYPCPPDLFLHMLLEYDHFSSLSVINPTR